MVSKDRLIKTFLDLANLNSPTFKEKPVADYILETFLQLGIEAFTDDSYLATGSDTGNVIARIPGKIDSQPLLLNAHMDTIESTAGLKTVIDEKAIRSDGTTILGSDCKAGIAVILEACYELKESDIAHGPVEIVFTVAEEVGLVGAKNLDYSKLNAKNGFIFDTGGNANHVIINAPSQDNISLKFKGKASHAGVCPERGINAILMASYAISKFPMGRLEEGTTANVGIISGGEATNIVTPQCDVKAEARSVDEEKLAKLVSQIIETSEKTAQEMGGSLEINLERIYSGFKISEDDIPARVASSALEELGLKPNLTLTCGGSDSNVFNERGIKSVTLSMGGEHAHSKEEMLPIDEFYMAAQNALKVIELFPKRCEECLI